MNNNFGLNIESAAVVDFTPIVKYDARSGRIFRVDRLNTGNGFENNPVDITQMFKAVFDFENVEVGWMLFAPNVAPSFALVPIGNQLPDRPSPTHKQGIRLLLRLNKTCGGDKPVREIAGNAKAFLGGMDEIYGEYKKEKDKYPGQLPVIVLVTTIPVTTGSGEKKSTNYQPKFRIDGWAPRPADLIHIRSPETVTPTASTSAAPQTGASMASPPGTVSDDNDFG